MRKGKYEAAASAKRRGNKSIALLLALFLLIGTVVGGTLAWLIDSSDAVTDTFTYGDINIKLTEGQTETAWSANKETRKTTNKLVPGGKITMNPYVKVETGSEKCFLFVEVVPTGFAGLFADTNTVALAAGWEAVDGNTNIYSRVVDTADMGKYLQIIANDGLTVLDAVEKADLKGLSEAANLKITAYAIQYDNLVAAGQTPTAEGAWAAMQAQLATP